MSVATAETVSPAPLTIESLVARYWLNQFLTANNIRSSADVKVELIGIVWLKLFQPIAHK